MPKVKNCLTCLHFKRYYGSEYGECSDGEMSGLKMDVEMARQTKCRDWTDEEKKPKVRLEPFEVIIPRKVYDKIIYLAQLASPNEIQLIGEVDFIDNLYFEVRDVYVIKQRVTAGSAEFIPQELARFIADHPNPEKLHLWVHSHVNMRAFWSETDLETIRRLGRDSWLVSIVMNLDGQMKARLDVPLKELVEIKEIKKGLFQEMAGLIPQVLTRENLKISVENTLSEDEKTKLQKDVEEKITRVLDESDGWLHRFYPRPLVSGRLFGEDEDEH